jgi:hypothetical protein
MHPWFLGTKAIESGKGFSDIHFFLRSLSQAPGLTGVRQKGGLPGHPPVVPHPESLAAQSAYPYGIRAQRYCPGQLRPEWFPGIGVLSPCYRVLYCE